MTTCKYCGAQLADDVLFCGECGTRVEKSQYNHGEPDQTVRAEPAQPVWNPNAAPQQPAQPAQPAWMQYTQPQGQPAWNQNNGYQPTQPVYVTRPQELGKGGGITMIVFGAILVGTFLLGLMGLLIGMIEGSAFDSEPSAIVGPITVMVLFFLGGGLMLLLFGIRKIRNVNKYNENIRNQFGR